MVAYLIGGEEEQKVSRDERRQKDLVFAINPELALRLWPDEDEGLTADEEEEIEFLIPENEGDVQTMMAELRSAGWGG